MVSCLAQLMPTASVNFGVRMAGEIPGSVTPKLSGRHKLSVQFPIVRRVDIIEQSGWDEPV